MKYTIKIDKEALNDIKEATLWYNEKQKGLGKKYQAQTVKQINDLAKNPLLFSIRYADIRCMKIKKFPFLVHYTVEGTVITIYAILHTSRNPEIWKKRGK